jgi:asparagine synthase (glutamine-hydrolysing)
MCGLVGFVGPRDDAVLVAMRDALRHRGPDGAGILADDRVSLGHRRLCIVDVQGGAQPMHADDGRTTVVYNGEIYNHPRLKAELESAGVRYRTRCDTETILHLYERDGFDCVLKFEGMFAFVLYDRRRKLLFGARDPMGEKPLYYMTPEAGDVRFAFASEPKALRRHPELASGFGLSKHGLIDYLLHDYTVGERTIAEGVRRLPPGHAFTFGFDDSERPGFHSWPYWSLDFRAAHENPDRVLDLLEAAVEKQLMSDVPLGLFLSGGVDSSSLVALLSRRRPAAEIDTFSIGFEDPSFDETEFSDAVARQFGTRHHHRRFTADDLLRQLPLLAEHLDEPFADPSVLPVSLLSEFARERVTAALGGDGGDELFAGYDPFRAIAPAWRYRRFMPSFIHERIVRPLARLLPATDANMGLAFKVQRFVRGLSASAAVQASVWMGPFSWDGLRRLMPSFTNGVSVEDAYAHEFAAVDRLEQSLMRKADDLTVALDFFQSIYLPDDILVKVDRASMRHSLEVRCPFLDPRLVEYANGLPATFKIRGGKTKAGFKDLLIARNILPDSIVHRRKKGFGIPVARWLKRELRGEFERRVLNGWPSDLPPLDRDEVERLWLPHLAGKVNNYKELWALLTLSWWRQAQA